MKEKLINLEKIQNDNCEKSLQLKELEIKYNQ